MDDIKILKELAKTLMQTLYAVDVSNASTPLNFNKLVEGFQKFDDGLKTVLTGSDISAKQKGRIIAATGQMFRDFESFFTPSAYSLEQTLTAKWNQFSHGLKSPYNFEGSDLGHQYTMNGKIHKGKSIPVYGLLQDASSHYTRKEVIYNHLYCVEEAMAADVGFDLNGKHFDDLKLTPLQIEGCKFGLNEGGQHYVAQDTSNGIQKKYRDEILEFYTNRREDSLARTVGLGSESFSTRELKASTVYNEVLETNYFNENTVKKYQLGYKEYQRKVTNLPKEAKVTSKMFRDATEIGKADIYPISKGTYNSLKGVSSDLSQLMTAQKDTSALYKYHNNYNKPHRLPSYQKMMVDMYWGDDFKKPLGGEVLTVSTEDLVTKKLGRHQLIKKGKVAGKRQLLGKVLTKIATGPVGVASDIADGINIGALLAAETVVLSVAIFAKLGWANPFPEQASLSFYEQRLQRLEKRKNLDQAAIINSKKGFVASQRIQTLKKQTPLVDAAIQLTKLNIRTTRICQLNTGNMPQVSREMEFATKELQKLKKGYAHFTKIEADAKQKGHSPYAFYNSGAMEPSRYITNCKRLAGMSEQEASRIVYSMSSQKYGGMSRQEAKQSFISMVRSKFGGASLAEVKQNIPIMQQKWIAAQKKNNHYEYALAKIRVEDSFGRFNQTLLAVK